jgi:hypothetical protein
MLYVGRACDPWFINELFHVAEFTQIPKHITEEEVFTLTESSAYQYALYTLINTHIRSQRQPFCELRVLLEGDPESENALKSLLVSDGVANAVYNIDFAKFQQGIVGSSSSGVGAAGGA